MCVNCPDHRSIAPDQITENGGHTTSYWVPTCIGVFTSIDGK